jgi:hypothetical protein
MAATKTEPQTAVTMKTVPATNGAPSGPIGSPPDPLVSPFGQMRALVEQMVKDAREEGRKAGIAEGRVEGLRRACTLLGIAMSQLSLEERGKVAKALEAVEYELTK